MPNTVKNKLHEDCNFQGMTDCNLQLTQPHIDTSQAQDGCWYLPEVAVEPHTAESGQQPAAPAGLAAVLPVLPTCNCSHLLPNNFQTDMDTRTLCSPESIVLRALCCCVHNSTHYDTLCGVGSIVIGTLCCFQPMTTLFVVLEILWPGCFVVLCSKAGTLSALGIMTHWLLLSLLTLLTASLCAVSKHNSCLLHQIAVLILHHFCWFFLITLLLAVLLLVVTKTLQHSPGLLLLLLLT